MTYVLQLAEHADLPAQTVDQGQQFDRGPGVGAEIHRLEDRRGSSG
jgi:hypothetical protein